MGRRTDAEIEAVRELHYKTSRVANDIEALVDPAAELGVSVSAQSLGGIRADYQRELADILVVSYSTRDAKLAEKVGHAIAACVEEYKKGVA